MFRLQKSWDWLCVYLDMQLKLWTWHKNTSFHSRYTPVLISRSVRTEEPMWGEEEDFSDHNYYNSIPGKEPPIGGVVDSRLRSSGAMLGHIHTQPQSKTAAQVSLRAWLWLERSGRGNSCGSTGVDFKKDTVDSWYLVVLWKYILYIFFDKNIKQLWSA